jgi:5'(3')-deoxyribonucleotidase
MRVAVDIDNVTLEWQYHWADLYQHQFDVEIPLARLATWDACLTETVFESMAEFYEWFNEADGWRTQPFVPGVQGALRWIGKMPDCRFLFVTARPPSGERAALALAGQFQVPVEFRNDLSKRLVRADIWVDDSPEVLADLAAAGKRAIRFVRPWNEGSPATYSAGNWPDVMSYIKGEMS